MFKVLDFGMKFVGLNKGFLTSSRFGATFVFDLQDYIHRKLLLNCFERADINHVLNLVDSGDYVVDIGANVGFITVPVARSVGDQGRVIAVEPIPSNFKELQAHIKLNRVSNVVLFHTAVGNSPHNLILDNLTDTSDISSGFWRRVETRSASSVDVPCVPLSEIIGGIPRISLLKVDAEGMEFEILSSAKDQINPKFISNLMIELTYNKDGIDKNSSDVVNLLIDRGYSIYRVSLFGNIRRIDPFEIGITNNVLNVFAS